MGRWHADVLVHRIVSQKRPKRLRISLLHQLTEITDDLDRVGHRRPPKDRNLNEYWGLLIVVQGHNGPRRPAVRRHADGHQAARSSTATRSRPRTDPAGRFSRNSLADQRPSRRGRAMGRRRMWQLPTI